MQFVYNDRGRSKYFKADKVGDCVCRAICNATGMDYKEVYDELPKGVLIVKVSKRLTCVKDGVLYDTYDCSRDGQRCVYGCWSKEEK